MKKELFDELTASVKEAGKIHRGKAKASQMIQEFPRVTVDIVCDHNECECSRSLSAVSLREGGYGFEDIPGQPVCPCGHPLEDHRVTGESLSDFEKGK